MPIELTATQEALLRLPEPDVFTQRIANEIRRDMGQDLSHVSDARLLQSVRDSYDFATNELHITRIPTLVRWVRVDVVADGALHREPAIVLKVKAAKDPNLAAEDLLSIFIAQARWSN
ncbi:hypothetical protein H8Z72_23215 (plasmid) [Xanthomonas citri pv. citri]|uniref:hypothetical protein n=1 Tax=Xanthomonas citri TaxID=346 RepID=UPI0019342337|nr:hypothetical protein [Xanthomonas citri]QRD62774.1 hypothetical protein H8Z74_22970 [Xanthomonas citri pv. citri]QRD67101.1 hypothetical protein H8Z73_23055 [Xanthomonas citri pv. citri]QRD71646.1 hypothetical protein H8Z72_23215 [Xanthomonas citri pv. citri]